MTPNAWGVEPGQTWIHNGVILLVLEESGGCEWYRCLILDSDPRCWIHNRETGPLVRLTAYLIAKGGQLA